MIAWRDVRIKYKQSVMGIMWAVFMPMIIVSAGILVKFGLAMVSNKPIDVSDIASVSVKAVPWAFFVSSVRFCTNSLLGNAGLVTKIYFPKLVFPIAAMFSQLFDFAIASALLILILGVMRIGLSIHLMWVPLILFLLLCLATGLGILLSAANLFYRDVKYLVEVILTFAIFFTPVFYDVSLFGKWGDLLMFNPVSPILEGLSSSVVHHQMPQIGWLIYSTVAAMCLSVLAFSVFKKLEPLFAERI
jgi:ABC-type polysaccharide/polyol phosphate export permease